MNNEKILPRFRAPEAKILVVDDLPTNIRLLKEMLNPCGMKMYVSLNGANAIALIQKERYDLVFMDYLMPEMDGIETIARIRALESGDADQTAYFHTIPIILLTANTEQVSKEAIMQNKNINGYITKPIDIALLFETVENLLPAGKVIPQ